MRARSRSRIAAAALLALSGAACTGPAPDPYWVGAVGLLAGRPAAVENLHGIQLAVAETNAQGGIHGHPVRLVVRNDGGIGDSAVRYATEMVKDQRILAVIGHTTSTAMMAALPVYDGHLVAVASTASAPSLSGLSRWVFRVIASDSLTGAQLARFAGARGWRRAAILYQNDVYGRGLADAFRLHYPGRVIASDPYRPGTTDFSVFARYYQRFTPDVVFVVAGLSEVPVAVRRELVRRDLHVAVLASEGSADLGDGAVRGDEIFVGAPFSGMDTRPSSRRFIEAFEARYGHVPRHDAALAYDAAMVVFAAIRAAGPDRAAIRGYLSSLDSVRAPVGATGPIFFNANGDRESSRAVVLQVKHGRMALVANQP